MVDKQEIMRLLNLYFKTTKQVTIDDKGLVSCTGDVRLAKPISHLPVQFDQVDGNFLCRNNRLLESLQGCPRYVGKHFDCSNNPLLKSLAGAPDKVRLDCRCNKNPSLRFLIGFPPVVGKNVEVNYNNLLESLDGLPQTVGGFFYCWGNKELQSLHGSPQYVKVSCSFDGLPKLLSLEGSPRTVGATFMINKTGIKTLKGAPLKVGTSFECYANPNLLSLEDLPLVKSFYISYSPALPLLRSLQANQIVIYGTKDNTVQDILNKYAGQGEAGAFACCAELATAGYKENARW